jgi:DNA topoisomerase-3
LTIVAITEKPNTAKILKGHVDWEVAAAQGHLVDTKEPEEINPEWTFGNRDCLPFLLEELPLKIGKDRSGASLRDKVDNIGRLLKKASCVVIACDPGREGSLIGWELLSWHDYRGPVKRLLLGALDPASVKKAIADMEANPRSGDQDYAAYREAQACQLDDWHSGMTGTRTVSLYLKPRDLPGVWSYGGVQIPTLALLYDREMEIQNFKPRDFYKIAMTVMTAQGHNLQLMYAPSDRIFELAAAQAIAGAAQVWAGKLAVQKKESKRTPPKLFSLNTLQGKCAKAFGWRPDYTEKVADTLYNAGFATYPRTEATYLKDAEAEMAVDVLKAIAASPTGYQRVAQHVLEKGANIRKGFTYKSTESEHYAYVPTRTPFDPDDIEGRFQKDCGLLYNLISQYFLAHHLPDAVDDVTTISADVLVQNKSATFRTSGTIERSPGWRVAFGKEAALSAEKEEAKGVSKHAAEEEQEGNLPPVENGEAARALPPPKGAEIVKGQTQPPNRITVGELPQVMARLIDVSRTPSSRRPFTTLPTRIFPKDWGRPRPERT